MDVETELKKITLELMSLKSTQPLAGSSIPAETWKTTTQTVTQSGGEQGAFYRMDITTENDFFGEIAVVSGDNTVLNPQTLPGSTFSRENSAPGSYTFAVRRNSARSFTAFLELNNTQAKPTLYFYLIFSGTSPQSETTVIFNRLPMLKVKKIK